MLSLQLSLGPVGAAAEVCPMLLSEHLVSCQGLQSLYPTFSCINNGCDCKLKVNSFQQFSYVSPVM